MTATLNPTTDGEIPIRRTHVVAALALVATLAFTSLTSLPASASSSKNISWVDQNVSFTSGDDDDLRDVSPPHRRRQVVPAVLLIAGSGPTDRNGNSSIEPGPIDTLKTLADWLSDDGVASLRYDKLGSGADRTRTVRAWIRRRSALTVFEQEARSALEFLAKEKDVNDHELGVFGHSEGALFALLLATGHAGSDAAHSRAGTLRAAQSALPRSHHGPGRRVTEGASEVRRDHEGVGEDRRKGPRDRRHADFAPRAPSRPICPTDSSNVLNPSDALFFVPGRQVRSRGLGQ